MRDRGAFGWAVRTGRGWDGRAEARRSPARPGAHRPGAGPIRAGTRTGSGPASSDERTAHADRWIQAEASEDRGLTEKAHSHLRVGVDIGGTFTDLSIADDSGIIAVGKTLTSPEEPARGVESVVRDALAGLGIEPGALSQIVHGTTLVTNAILERKGARTALMTTAGFRDTLELATEKRYDLYDLDIELPRPLVPRHLCFDVPERTYADGEIAVAVDEDHVERLARELAASGIEAVAVCFLHSFTNPANELAARAAIERVAPTLRVALSSEVSPEVREYERASTTVASVYVQDVVERYLADLQGRLRSMGYPGELHVMLSNGGIATVETATRHPIRLLESGPAAGALAAAAFGAMEGRPDLVSFDMGGTTAKLCLIEDGRPLVTQEIEVDRQHRLLRGSGLPVKVAAIDMIEIGVGGGSIARIDALGLLKAGPDSAGAVPGPACYGRGGTLPTVTDADLVLGYLDPEYFLGGAMKLDVEAARAAIEEHVAQPSGLAVEEAAFGVHQVVNENMANAARVHAVERGKNPSDLPLFAFGGAGPVHAAGVAHRLGSALVIVPPAAGVTSTIGFLTAPLAFDFVRSRRALLDEIDDDAAESIFRELEHQGLAVLRAAGVAPTSIAHERSADMRLVGQGHEINVRLAADGRWPESAQAAFEAAYQKLYERLGPNVPVEVMRWRLVSTAPSPSLPLRARKLDGRARALKGTRRAWLGHERGLVEARVYDRYALRPSDRVDGPAIIEERESTTLVPAGASCRIGDDLALVVHLVQEPS